MYLCQRVNLHQVAGRGLNYEEEIIENEEPFVIHYTHLLSVHQTDRINSEGNKKMYKIRTAYGGLTMLCDEPEGTQAQKDMSSDIAQLEERIRCARRTPPPPLQPTPLFVQYYYLNEVKVVNDEANRLPVLYCLCHGPQWRSGVVDFKVSVTLTLTPFPSMLRPRMRKAHLAKTPPATPSRSDYYAFPSSPCSKSPSKWRAQPILYGVNGSVLSQRKLPTPIGQFGFLERPQTDIDTSPSVPLEPNTESLASSEIVSPSAPPTAHRQKRLAQTLQWQNDVLPTLIAPYMNYLRQSADLSKEVEDSVYWMLWLFDSI
ncbi:hypothetical protein GGU11DRAFT_761590, partial [Lentinula aff. detonsa]